MNRRRVVAMLAALQVVTFATATGQAQGGQHALAQQVLSGNVADQSRAVWAAMALGSQATGPLRAALITLLERNNRILDEAAKRKVTLDRLIDPEFVAHVAHAVSQLEDPQAIPALAGALGSGSTLVRDALADFGERAAGAVVRVVTNPETRDHEAVDDGLLSLRFMVEGRGARPLSAGTLDEIRRAAKQRLTGKQYFTTLWKAIDLAVVLDDSELTRIVESLTTNRGEVAARGIEDPELIQDTQKLAAGRLAARGRPFRPQYRTPAERARALGVPARADDGPPVIIKPR
jgi:hypothetical protein